MRSHQKQTKIGYDSGSVWLNQHFEKLTFTLNDKAYYIITRSESLFLNKQEPSNVAIFEPLSPGYCIRFECQTPFKPFQQVSDLAFALRSSGCYLLFLLEFIKPYLRYVSYLSLLQHFYFTRIRLQLLCMIALKIYVKNFRRARFPNVIMMIPFIFARDLQIMVYFC